MKNKVKRNSRQRSKVVLDVDDIQILKELEESKNLRGVKLDYLKDALRFSHNALLVHLRRLLQNDLIVVFRSEDDYKFKAVTITERGKKLIKLLGEKQKNIPLTKDGLGKIEVLRKY